MYNVNKTVVAVVIIIQVRMASVKGFTRQGLFKTETFLLPISHLKTLSVLPDWLQSFPVQSFLHSHT